MDLLTKTVRKNPGLIRAATMLHRSGAIQPDTYVIDLDMIRGNAEKMYREADRVGIECLICAKQFGRNPLVIKSIMNAGMRETMAMDIEGLKNLYRYGFSIAHVGHFGQVPNAEVKFVLEKIQPRVMTVYTLERARQVSKVAKELGITQKVLVKVIEDPRYERLATAAGMAEEEAFSFAKQLKELDNIKVVGATAYPAFDFSLITKTHSPSNVIKAMLRVVDRMRKELGIEIEHVNAPGRNCAANMELAAKIGATVVEPGQSFLGTLPNHLFEDDSPEQPAVAYVSEISHFFAGYAIAFGESFMATAVMGSLKNDIRIENIYACVGDDPDKIVEKKLALARPQEFWQSDLGWSMYATVMPTKEHDAKVGDTVVFGYRPQVYRVPKGRVAVVAGVQSNNPKLLGIFDRAGLLLDRDSDDPVGYDKNEVLRMMDKLP